MLERRRYSEHPPRDEYVLTERGRDFRPVLLAMLAWGNRHFAPEGARRADRRCADRRAGRSDPGRSRPPAGRLTDPDYRDSAPGPAAHRGDRAAPAGHAAAGCVARRRRHASVAISAAAPAATAPAAAAINPRTQRLLHGPIVPTLLRLAWPNILVMLAQASTGLIETWFVSRLGTDALAGMALVFPGFMMMQMLSGGAMGGGISSAIARALGGRPARRRRCAGAARDHHQRRARRWRSPRWC